MDTFKLPKTVEGRTPTDVPVDPPTPTDPPLPSGPPPIENPVPPVGPPADPPVDPPAPPTDPPAEPKLNGDVDYTKLEKVTVETEEGEKELYINKDGDYINNTGEVVYTKDALESAGATDYEKFFENIEIPIIDEQGKPKEYTPSIEGFKAYTKDLYENAVNETLANNNESVFKSNLYSKHPVLADVVEYIEKNGSLSGFNTEVDLTVAITEDNKETQRAFVRKDRLDKGETAEEADAYIKYLEAEDKLLPTSKNIQSRMVEAKKNSASLAKQQQVQEYINTWGMSPETNAPVPNASNSVYDLVFNKKQLTLDTDKTLTIPDTIRVKQGDSFIPKTREDFFRFIYDKKPVTIGNQTSYMSDYEVTQYQTSQKENINHDLYKAFKAFANYDPLATTNRDTDANYKEAKRKLKLKSSGQSTTNNNSNTKFKLKRQIR